MAGGGLVNRGGRGKIACTPEKQRRVLWLISSGWSGNRAADAVGINAVSITRQARRDPQFKTALDAAYQLRRARRPVAVHR